MYAPVHAPIIVVAEFPEKGKVKIHSFIWEGKEYKIEQVDLVTRANKGNERVWLFNVSTKTAAFQLRLDTDNLKWYLEELTWDEAKT